MLRVLSGCAVAALLALGAASGCTSYATQADLTRNEVQEDLAGPDPMVGESNAEANQREALEDVIDDSDR